MAPAGHAIPDPFPGRRPVRSDQRRPELLGTPPTPADHWQPNRPRIHLSDYRRASA
jgi:hypothetical protein